jgi:hypothetical protein
MAQTIQQIINDAFTTIGVVADGRAPSATQAAKGLEVLNDNLATQQKDGWRLGWFPQTNLAATAPLRDEDIGDVKLMLAKWLAPRYGVKFDLQNDALILTQMADAERRLTKRSLKFMESDLGELQRPQGGPWGGPNWL